MLVVVRIWEGLGDVFFFFFFFNILTCSHMCHWLHPVLCYFGLNCLQHVESLQVQGLNLCPLQSRFPPLGHQERPWGEVILSSLSCRQNCWDLALSFLGGLDLDSGPCLLSRALPWTCRCRPSLTTWPGWAARERDCRLGVV